MAPSGLKVYAITANINHKNGLEPKDYTRQAGLVIATKKVAVLNLKSFIVNDYNEGGNLCYS